ncbi:MAG TPA: DUF3631 domain-containing protein [Propionibacteriaceae bacterium]|nr:DUF3631 domain-containing protein [Propionibacteriaceae bacterium]
MTTDHQPTISDGAELLDQVRTAVARYVRLPSQDAMNAVVLWIAASHAVPAWNAAPRLVIRAPEKRCGKSRLLDLVEALCHRPIVTANASPAAVYRCIGESPNDPPTLLIDEADTIFGPRAGDANEDLRGLLNAGHQRNRPALRWNAARNELDHIPTFGMAALAGIGTMPDTIEDRAVVIVMRRRAPDEEVQPYRARRDGPALHQLRDQLHAWAVDQLAGLRDAAPALPVEDRAADTWEPLVAVADSAGGHWPTTARTACLTLTANEDTAESVSLRVRLLMDCRTAFADAAGLPSATLLERLRADDEAPWTSYGRDGLTTRGLSAMLRDFDISSSNRRWPDGGQSKGYLRDDFADAWSRYCPPPPGRLSVPAVPPSQPPESGTETRPWDGSSVPTPASRPKTTPVGRRDGWDGNTAPTRRAVCITCREPLSYDDGTHTHPTCTTA